MMSLVIFAPVPTKVPNSCSWNKRPNAVPDSDSIKPLDAISSPSSLELVYTPAPLFFIPLPCLFPSFPYTALPDLGLYE